MPVVHVASSRAALAELAARFFGHPARGLEVIGFTGTFGKTSTSAILRDLLTKAGSKPGAIRGSRGEDINHRNALALADLVAEHGFDRLVVTGSQDAAGPSDRPVSGEVDAARSAFAKRFQRFEWFDELDAAARFALGATAPGDLIVLVGAQGMDAGRRCLSSAGISPQT